jgi:hypothetical protein
MRRRAKNKRRGRTNGILAVRAQNSQNRVWDCAQRLQARDGLYTDTGRWWLSWEHRKDLNLSWTFNEVYHFWADDGQQQNGPCSRFNSIQYKRL